MEHCGDALYGCVVVGLAAVLTNDDQKEERNPLICVCFSQAALRELRLLRNHKRDT